MFYFETVDLLTLKDEKLQEQILSLTQPGWSAHNTFNSIFIDCWYKPTKCIMRLAFTENAKPVAWACCIRKHGHLSDEVWCFTKASYRKRGLQKTLLSYMKKHHPNCKYQSLFLSQKETFKYYDTKENS